MLVQEADIQIKVKDKNVRSKRKVNDSFITFQT